MLQEDYINQTANGNLSWKSASSCTSDLEEALENWKNRLHEFSVMRCARITRSMQWVENELREFPTYEGFPNLVTFLSEFEGLITESQDVYALYRVLKAMLARW